MLTVSTLAFITLRCADTLVRLARMERIAVLGNGIIGHGVAQIFAMAGHPVTMIGRSLASLEQAQTRIHASLDEFSRHGLIDQPIEIESVLGRITLSTALADAAGAGMVIEVVTEDLPLKRDLFGQLDQICAPETILASSSGQPPSALYQQVTHRGRVIATHFWYPPQLIPLVEVCGGPLCDPAVLARSCALIRGAGKEPVVIDREIAGFIGNRIQFAMLREAWSLWASGAASAEAIDAVVRNSIGRRLAITGPLESADLGGLPTMVAFARSLQPDLDVSALPPSALDGLAQGVSGKSDAEREALRVARQAELFRWMQQDRGV
jgi:3-hydroxybutyryl-CoA dehydrogenase